MSEIQDKIFEGLRKENLCTGFSICDLNFENIAWKGYRIKNKDFEIKIDYEIAEKYKKLFTLKKTGKEYNCDGVLYD